MVRALRVPYMVGLVALSAAFVGCSDDGAGKKVEIVPPSPTKESTATQKVEEEHGHKVSARGGIIVPIGRDNYHAEAVFEKGGVLRLYILGQDEAKVVEVEAQPLAGFIKVEGDAEATSFVLRPEPQTEDKTGMTSQFQAVLPKEMIGKRLEVTIPSIRIGGERFRVGFKSVAEDSHADATMPPKVSNDDERKLYLTPGGLYTEADIKANGNTIASRKFMGLKAEHDLKPKSGDKICPITLTKANLKFTWIVGGKLYQFCCPPCVDEFVATAKEKPGEIRDPEEYRQK